MILAACAACGGDDSPVSYSNPTTGALRLVQTDSSGTTVNLQLVVADDPLTGYTVGFDLPLDDTLVTFGTFTPGTALDPGSAPIAAQGTISTTGPLAHQLVTGQSQKAAGAGAVSTDTTLAPGTVVYSFSLISTGHSGIVFDGTSSDFALASGGMRDRLGNVVVAPRDVAIGKLELHGD